MAADEMDIDELQARLHRIDVDVPQATLRRWAYDKRQIIPRPQRYKHGPGSGKSGRAAKWSEEAFLEAAAVWAVLHFSGERGPPPLDLIPYVKESARQPYETVTAGYTAHHLSADSRPIKITSESLTVTLGHPKSLKKEPAGWQELLATWIAAIEKARHGISINTPKQVRFHWRSKKVKEGTTYVPESVNDNNVSLHESELGHDELAILINGVDVRETVARMLSGTMASQQ